MHRSLRTAGIVNPSSWDWKREFEDNSVFVVVPRTEDPLLSHDEQALIFPSIRDFQRGEYSEGKHLLAVAREFGKQVGDSEYPEIMKLFIREEQRHSQHLADYMKIYNVCPQKHIFIDKVFRFLRKRCGLLSEVSVLVTAEMMALFYYDALSRSTPSTVLPTICAQMLQDETRHVVWQSYTLHRLMNDKTEAHQRRFILYRKALFSLTRTLIWHKYRSVFIAGGYRKEQFYHEAHEVLSESLHIQVHGSLS